MLVEQQSFRFSVHLFPMAGVHVNIIVPYTLNSKPTPGGRRIDVTAVPLHWAYNPVHTV